MVNHRIQAYFYSALSALFFFVILRQIGLIEQRDLNSLVGDETFLRSSSNSGFIIQAQGIGNRKAASEDPNYFGGLGAAVPQLGAVDRTSESSLIQIPGANVTATTAAAVVNFQNPKSVQVKIPTTTNNGQAAALTPQNQPQLTVKPPIYTFFTGVHDSASFTGMNAESDNQLLQTWKDEW